MKKNICENLRDQSAFKRARRLALKAGILPVALSAVSALASVPSSAWAADNFPSKPVTIVVPFAAGGATDLTARLVAQGLSKKWGQSVIVDNKPGAGGNVGSEYVARAAPDGYTIVLGVTGSHGINVSLHKDMRFHPLKDFEPLSQATLYPNAIAVHPSVAANNLQELIALIKANPEKYPYGTDGNGTASHLGMALLTHRAELDIVSVPYRGGAPMVVDLIGGQIPIGITGLPAIQSHAREGKLKILALTTPERFAGAPDYPTVAEQGFPGFGAAPWSGFFAPKGTPTDIVQKLSKDMNEVMQDKEAQEKMLAAGSALTPNTPAEFRAFVEKEVAGWAEAVRVSGAKVD